MSIRDVLVLYAVIGLACAIAVFKRSKVHGVSAVAAAMITVPLWPLWAPFALGPTSARERARPEARPEIEAIVARVDKALADAVEAVAGTPLSGVFTEATAARIASEVMQVAVRLADLGDLAEKSGFDRAASAKRLEDLEKAGIQGRAVATARLQHESLERLSELRAADARALEEMADLLEALRTQLVLARYAGSSADGASEIVSEIWARLEGLGAVIDSAT